MTSIVRLKYIVTFANSLDSTCEQFSKINNGRGDQLITRLIGDNVDVANWSIIEVACAIICGSLPTLRPLFRKVPGLLTSLKSREGTKNLSSSRLQEQPPSRPCKDSQLSPVAGPFEKMEDYSRFNGSTWKEASGPRLGQIKETISSQSVNSQLEYELRQWTTEGKEQRIRVAV